MGLQFFKWLFPIAVELIKGNQRFKMYTKRNMSLVFIIAAGLFSMCLNLYFFEQASAYGAKHKDINHDLTAITERLSSCSKEIEQLKETIKACSEQPSRQINNE